VAAFETLCTVGDTSLTFESGLVANCADGSIVATQVNSEGKSTSVLATVCAKPEIPFSRNGTYSGPTIEYRNQESAANRIPRSRNRRPMAPSDSERKSTTVLRRAVSSLFPAGWLSDTHITAVTHASYDGDPNAEVLAANAISAALVVSGIPWAGPVGVVRVALCGDQILVNPSAVQLKDSEWSGLYGGNADECVLLDFAVRKHVVEPAAIIEACEKAHEECRTIINAQLYLKAMATEERTDLAGSVVECDAMFSKAAGLLFGAEVAAASQAGDTNALEKVIEKSSKVLLQSSAASTFGQAFTVLRQVEMDVAAPASDSLELTDVDWRVPMFVGLHGSALLTTRRDSGPNTQVMANVTVASGKDAYQSDHTDDLAWPLRGLMVHHSVPGFAEGKTTWLKMAQAEEIATGDFVERAIAPALGPSRGSKTLKVSSQVTQAAGSACTAAVNAAVMALRHADVPAELVSAVTVSAFRAAQANPVFVCNPSSTEQRIQSAELQIAGTKDGITACRALSVEAPISLELLARMIEASAQPRIAQLQQMENAALSLGPSSAPASAELTIATRNVGKLIGRGGSTIQLLQSTTGAEINIDRDTGAVAIFGPSQKVVDSAKEQIEQLMAGSDSPPIPRQPPITLPDVGVVLEGRVTKVQTNGVQYELSVDGKSCRGFCPLSMLEAKYTSDPSKVVAVGDMMPMKVMEQRDNGVLISRKDATAAKSPSE